MPLARWSGSVHPRVCGEQERCAKSQSIGDGSSPRVRGTAALTATALVADRFIPACAGNRQYYEDPAHIVAVHPRVCGEQLCEK